MKKVIYMACVVAVMTTAQAKPMDQAKLSIHKNNTLYTTNFTEPLSYQDSAFLKLPKFP